MKKFLFALATIAGFAMVSCSKEVESIDTPEKPMRHLTVIAQTPNTKVTLDDQHNALQWTASDNIRIMTNTEDAGHDAKTLQYTANGLFEVTVNADASEAYAYYKAGTFDDDAHSTPTAFSAYIDAEQTQTEAGVFNGEWLPMAAKGTINTSNNTVTLDFHPMAGVLALNIYNTNKPTGEKIAKVTVKPDAANTHFCGLYAGVDLTQDDVIYAQGTSTSHTSVSVTLGTAYDYATAKPTDKRMAPGQIYVVLAKQNYKSVKFEIETEAGEKYEITSSATTGLDLVNNDFYPVNINLDKATKVVAYEESFASNQGLFTIEDETLPSALTFVWSHSSNYMKASAYKSGNYEASSRLISPVLTLGANSVLSFSHAANYMTNKTNVKNAFLVQIKKVGETSWTDLSLSDESYPDGASWTFADATVALPAAYANQNVQIAFHYTSTSSMAGTWEIRDFKVTYAELVQPKAFSVTTASPIEVPADPTGNSYNIAIEADSDVAWTAVLTEGDANALTLSTASGTGNGTIDLTIGKNTGAARNWKIEVSTSAYVATSSYTIQVVQAKGTTGSTTDVLDRAFTGIEDGATTYSEWSGKTGASGAVYAGQSAGSYNAIQLRSNNSNSGIITTATGGNVKKVTITWNSNTASSRTVSIYGKTSAYSAVSELYNSTNQGTLLGELNIDDATNKVSELTVAGNYQYIGIRSKSGALYIDKIDIEWSTEEAATYNITIDPDIEHGSVTASKATGVAEGESVTLTVNPSSGYQLETLIVDGTDVASSVVNMKYSFEMPANDVDVSATFGLIPTYNITIDDTIENGNVHATKTTGIVGGESITLSIAPNSGYALESLFVDGDDVTSSVSAGQYVFNMPGNDVFVTATFEVSINKTEQTLFHESFGDNSSSARNWSNAYSVKSGLTSVYSGASYTITNAKQSKNTMGQTQSALVSGQGTVGTFIVGPLNVSDCEDMVVTNYYGMSSGTWNSGSYMKCYYSTDGSTYTEVSNSSNATPAGAVSNNKNLVIAEYSLPSAAISSTLYLKFEFYCYQINKNSTEIGQAYFDEVDLTGKK